MPSQRPASFAVYAAQWTAPTRQRAIALNSGRATIVAARRVCDVDRVGGGKSVDFTRLIIVGAAAFGLFGCVSAEEQLAMDIQRCGGFGFAPGSEGMANCLLSITQQREAEAAAERRTFEQNRLISEQQNREREAAERSRRGATTS